MTFWDFLDKNTDLLLAIVISLVVLFVLLYLIGRYHVLPKLKKFFESFDHLQNTVQNIVTKVSIIEAASTSFKKEQEEFKKNTNEHLHLIGKMTETNIVEMKTIIVDMAQQVSELRTLVFTILKEHYKNHPEQDE